MARAVLIARQKNTSTRAMRRNANIADLRLAGAAVPTALPKNIATDQAAISAVGAGHLQREVVALTAQPANTKNK